MGRAGGFRSNDWAVTNALFHADRWYTETQCGRNEKPDKRSFGNGDANIRSTDGDDSAVGEQECLPDQGDRDKTPSILSLTCDCVEALYGALKRLKRESKLPDDLPSGKNSIILLAARLLGAMDNMQFLPSQVSSMLTVGTIKLCDLETIGVRIQNVGNFGRVMAIEEPDGSLSVVRVAMASPIDIVEPEDREKINVSPDGKTVTMSRGSLSAGGRVLYTIKYDNEVNDHAKIPEFKPGVKVNIIIIVGDPPSKSYKVTYEIGKKYQITVASAQITELPLPS